MTLDEYELKNIACFELVLALYKDLAKSPFVIAGFLLTPIYFGVSFWSETALNITVVISYFILIALTLYIVARDVNKRINSQKIPFFHTFLLCSLIGGAIYSASFLESYHNYKDNSEYAFLASMAHAAINTLIWKIFFYIGVGSLCYFYRRFDFKKFPNIKLLMEKLIIFGFFTFLLTNAILFSQWFTKL